MTVISDLKAYWRWWLPLAVLLLYNSTKGLQYLTQGWGAPYWLIDYSHGFVRRGVLGQIFSLFSEGATPAALVLPIFIFHALCVSAVAAVILIWTVQAFARVEPERRGVCAGILVWFFAAQFWPTLVFNVGYLDVVVVLISIGVLLALRSGHPMMAGLMAALGPLVHEYFVFLVPFVFVCGLGMKPLPQDGGGSDGAFKVRLRGAAIAAACAAVSALLVLVLADQRAIVAEVGEMVLPAEIKQVLIDTTFTQSITQSLRAMAVHFSSDAGYTIWNFAFFLLPTLVLCAALVGLHPAPRRKWAYAKILAALVPLAALSIAWDLSRLLVMTNFTAGVAVLLSLVDLSPRGVRRDA